jgi:hypothetical protein
MLTNITKISLIFCLFFLEAKNICVPPCILHLLCVLISIKMGVSNEGEGSLLIT